MERRSEIEHDFLGVHSNSIEPTLQRRQSFRGITKMNPEIVKKVMAWASKPTPAPAPTPALVAEDEAAFQTSLPVYKPFTFSSEGSLGIQTDKQTEKETVSAAVAPLTIFYKGTVTVVDLPQDKADSFFKFVGSQCSSSSSSSVVPVIPIDDHPHPVDDNNINTTDDGDMPIKRYKSLQRFYEKRKQRLISVSPCHVDHVSHSSRKSFA